LLRHSARHIANAEAIGLHYSIASKSAEAALASDAQLVLCYHNITPGDLLRPFNGRIAKLCDEGRECLPRFREKVAVAVADSSFNADELIRAGIREVAVVPLLLNLPAKPEQSPRFAEAPIVLFVGRIAPNKRLEDLITAFGLYQQHRERESSLILVGTDVSFESYRLQLQRLVDSLGVGRVVFTGRVSSRERDDWYRRASVYVSTSVHEGFCAPLVEALAHGIPVVARAAAAVPETLGGAGLLVDGRTDDVAEAIDDAVSNPATRAALASAAARRLAELQPEVVAPRLRDALAPVIA
jgi:glycosyltransferase involved in cell wall biosynthesis